MSDSMISIVPSRKNRGASFDPNPLSAQQNDVICWQNMTDETHQPWPLDDEGNFLPASSLPRGSTNYLCDPIPPNQSSRPSYICAQPSASPAPANWTVNYGCLTHPKRIFERGQISAIQQVYTNTTPQTTPDE